MKNTEIAKEIEELKKRVKDLEDKPAPVVATVVVSAPYPVYPDPIPWYPNYPWPYRGPYYISCGTNTGDVTTV